MAHIRIYADNNWFDTDIHKGQQIAFTYLPQGRNTRQGKEQPVPKATLLNEDGRAISASYETVAGLFRKKVVQRTCTILHRVHTRKGETPAYRVADYVAGLNI